MKDTSHYISLSVKVKMHTSAFAYLWAIILVLTSNADAQSGWFALNSGTTFNIPDIQFLDQNTGYISSPARKTTNGGISWFSLGVSSGLGLYFIDANTGWLVGANGYIRRTTNGGVSWFSTLPLPYPSALFEVFFVNSITGMIVGGLQQNGLGAFYYTTDGGNSWADRSPFWAFEAENYDVNFFDANTGIVASFRSILKTTNAGLNWNRVYIEFLRAVSFAAGTNLGFVAGFDSHILRSTDRGDTWTLVYSTSSGAFYDIFCIDTNNATAVGDGGRILRSTNGGLNWISQVSGTTRTLRAVHFINANTGWVCGDSGTLLKTTTGGFTAISPISNEIPKDYKLYQNYPNPFNPGTKIRFDLSSVGQRQVFDLQLINYDALGREVAVLVNEQLKPGTYEIEFDGTNYPSGVYFYKLITVDYTDTKKMVLLR